jgi:pyridoxal phosphate enzyme (YggS family)
MLLPVSKSVPADRIAAALSFGLTAFGENRVQEAETKAAAVPGARWELVGRLQSNKAARALAVFEVIHSVESVDLARRLDRLAGESARPARMPVYLEVNVDADPAKAGFAPADLAGSLDELVTLDRLELRGLMTVGRLLGRPEDARPTFAALRGLAEDLRGRSPALGPGLSMGMSADFEVAVEEGSTVVRVGSAIFGARRPFGARPSDAA